MSTNASSPGKCSNCNSSTNFVVQCIECEIPTITLCVPCFASGAEFQQHKKGHAYIVVDNGSFTLFKNYNSWSAGEELNLVESVDHCGYGNWEDIATHLSISNPLNVRDHFHDLYINGPLSDLFKLPTTCTIHDHTISLGSVAAKAALSPIPASSLKAEDASALAYIPLRGDFEREYDNEAEQAISSLSIRYDDDELEVALKLALVDIYLKKLRERDKRKAVITGFNLVSEQCDINQLDPRLVKENLRFVVQLIEPPRLLEILNLIDEERKLKSRIEERVQLYCQEPKKSPWKSPKFKKSGGPFKSKPSSTTVGILSPEEVGFCSAMGWDSEKYTAVKALALRELGEHRGKAAAIRLRTACSLGKNESMTVIKFFTGNGWLATNLF